MKRIFIIILAAVALQAVAQPAYTIEQIVDSARRNNVAMRVARHEVDAATQQRKEAFTRYFPSVSGTGLWFNANKSLVSASLDPSALIPQDAMAALGQSLPMEVFAALANPIDVNLLKNGAIAGVNAVQPVFAGRQIVNGNRLARVGEDVSRLRLDMTTDEVTLAVEQEFWTLVSLQEKLKTIDAMSELLATLHHDVGLAVDVGVGYSYNNLMDRSMNRAMVFATVSVPLSDWWGGSHAQRRARIKLAEAQEQLDDNSALLKIKMQRAWDDVENAYRQLEIARRSIEQAQENLRLNRDYYHAGISPMSDLLEAQALYQQACDKHVDAAVDYRLNLRRYRQATGTDR